MKEILIDAQYSTRNLSDFITLDFEAYNRDKNFYDLSLEEQDIFVKEWLEEGLKEDVIRYYERNDKAIKIQQPHIDEDNSGLTIKFQPSRLYCSNPDWSYSYCGEDWWRHVNPFKDIYITNPEFKKMIVDDLDPNNLFKQAISYPFFYVINVFENVSTGYSTNPFTDVAKIAVPENIQEYSFIIRIDGFMNCLSILPTLLSMN